MGWREESRIYFIGQSKESFIKIVIETMLTQKSQNSSRLTDTKVPVVSLRRSVSTRDGSSMTV